MKITLRPFRPIKPGEILQEELDARGWNPSDFAAISGRSTHEVNEIITGNEAIGLGFARVSDGSSPFTFAPESTVHSFAISMMARTQNDGTVAAVNASALAAKTEIKKAGTREFDCPRQFQR